MKVIQSPLFERNVKKLKKNQKLSLDEQILKIIKNPGIGEEKRGDSRKLLQGFKKIFEKQIRAITRAGKTGPSFYVRPCPVGALAA